LSKLETSHLRVKQLDDVAIASGSIAEVFFGELEDGTQIAVKCLRPDVCDLLEGDLAWMLHLGEMADNDPRYALLNLRRAAEDFCEHVQMQVDFEIEANNLRRFRKNFANSGENVRFPEPLYARPDLLVETRESGENLSNIFRAADDVASKRLNLKSALFRTPTSAKWPGGGDPEEKARYCTDEEFNLLQARKADIMEVLGVPARTTRQIGVAILECYMRMIFNDAFLHCDLHPGNMMVKLNPGAYDDDSGTARETQVGGWRKQLGSLLPESLGRHIYVPPPPLFELVVLDAGLAVPLDPVRVEALRSMAVSMIYCDFKGSATHIYDQSPDKTKCKDPEAFKDSLANVFRGVRKTVKEAGYVQVSDASLESLRLVNHHQVKLDTGMTWALFAMLSAEGSSRQLDPEADCTGAAARYIITMPSLFREMKHQPPEVLFKMVKEIVYGRKTHKAHIEAAAQPSVA